MTKQFVSVISGGAMHDYDTGEIMFASEEKGENGVFFGVGLFDNNAQFIFVADESVVGESSSEDDYQSAILPLTLPKTDKKLIARQLREIADFLEQQ